MPVVSISSGAMKVKTLKVAAQIRTVRASASRTCGLARTLNSLASLVWPARPLSGSHAAIATVAIAPITVTAQKVERQPKA